jgi:hypothetical protein
VPLSSFQLVGLGEVRERLAERWPALSEKMHLIASNTIARHLVRGDVFERHGEDAYLLLFATLGPAEAEFKSRVISREITEHLLGVGGDQPIGVTTVCTTVSAAALAQEGGERAVVEALAAAAPVTPAPESTVTAAEPAPNGAGTRADGAFAEQRRDAQRHAYTPVWDVTQMTLLRYRAAAPAAGEPTPGERFETSLRLLRSVRDDLNALAGAGARRPVTLAIHQHSLGGNAERTQLRQALSEIADPLRRLVTVEIAFAHDGHWSYGCRTFVEATRALGVRYGVLLNWEQMLTLPGDAGVQTAAVSLASANVGEGASLSLMHGFASRARTLGLDAAAHHLGTRPLVLGALSAGFRFLSGPCVQPDTPSLTNAVRFEPLDLYADLVREGAALKLR